MKQFGALILMVVAFVSTTHAQNLRNDVYKWYQVNQRAQFPGGAKAFDHYIDKNLNLPNKAYRKAKSGTVMVNFTIEKNGAITNVHCVNDPKLGYGVESAVVQVIRRMPRWEPARKDGEPVRMAFSKPIRLNFN